ncbi:MAG TPA: hypothetical protein VM030_07980 [Acidimicrobiales bacterium]|nr:hypothetical protein [Acidimicrobiales bacterium]
MGKASTGKKVARAAGTGGGRTARGRRPWGWYSAIAVVSILGVLLIVVSRGDLKQSRITGHPKVGEHWHVAYGFNVCGAYLPASSNDRDPLGIHTHNTEGVGDGVVHIHPFTSKAAGARATLGVFTDTIGAKLSRTKFELPGQKAHKTGDMCGDKKGVLRVSVNGKEYRGDPKKVRFAKDRSWVVVAILPAGDKIQPPPSVAQLDNLSDVGGPQGNQPPPVTIQPTPEGSTPEGSTPPGSTPGSQPDPSSPSSSAPAPPASTATSSP